MPTRKVDRRRTQKRPADTDSSDDSITEHRLHPKANGGGMPADKKSLNAAKLKPKKSPAGRKESHNGIVRKKSVVKASVSKESTDEDDSESTSMDSSDDSSVKVLSKLKKKATSDEDFEDDASESDEEEEENEVQPPFIKSNKTGRTSKSVKATPSQSRVAKATKESSDGDYKVTVNSSRKSARKSAGRKQVLNSDDDDESDDIVPQSKRKVSKPRWQSMQKKALELDDSDLDDDTSNNEDDTPHYKRLRRSTLSPSVSHGPSPTRETPTRQSAVKANHRLINYKDYDIDPAFIGKRKKIADADDESYSENDEEEEEEEESEAADDLQSGSSDDEDGDSSGEDEEEGIHQSARAGRVRDDDIGTADESSEDEGDKQPKAIYESPCLSILGTIEPRIKSLSQFEDSSDSSASRHHRNNRPSMSPPKVPSCKSKEDAITAETLPELHVCYYPPAAKDCQCFSLATLRRIALTTSRPAYGRNGKRTFLQPPHFRTIILDDLEDQIASRFGREALDIEGPYYKREEVALPVEDNAIDTYDRRVQNNFQDAFNYYLRSNMGSRDLYCCPLCYTVAYNRLRPPARASMTSNRKSSIEERYTTDFTVDPMTVLASLDDNLQVASALCFSSAAKTKQHLREDHGVDTKVVQGNGLYERYQIRKTDGLLQRWIPYKRMSHPMNRKYIPQWYWFGGYNQDFLHLLQLSDAAQQYRQVDSAATARAQEAEDYLAPAFEYFDSFRYDAKELWELLSSPFSTANDLDDFVADEDEVGHLGPSPQLVYRDIERQEQEEEFEEDAKIVARYNELERENRAIDSDDEVHEDAETVDSSGSDDPFDESEEDDIEEDHWMRAKEKKLEKKLESAVNKRRLSRSSRASRTSSASMSPVELAEPLVASKRKRLSIECDDED